MPHSPITVANQFLTVAADHGEALTHMKLQKLAYYAHGWHLGITSNPLVDEPILAWQYGPVIFSIYREFAEYGRMEIHGPTIVCVLDPQGRPMAQTPLIEGDEFALAVVDRIWDIYGELTAIQLSKMTHAEDSPWHQVVSGYSEGELPRGLEIPNDLIREHFQQRTTAA